MESGLTALVAETGLGREPLSVNEAKIDQASDQGLRERGRGPAPQGGGVYFSRAPKEQQQLQGQRPQLFLLYERLPCFRLHTKHYLPP